MKISPASTRDFTVGDLLSMKITNQTTTGPPPLLSGQGLATVQLSQHFESKHPGSCQLGISRFPNDVIHLVGLAKPYYHRMTVEMEICMHMQPSYNSAATQLQLSCNSAATRTRFLTHNAVTRVQEKKIGQALKIKHIIRMASDIEYSRP